MSELLQFVIDDNNNYEFYDSEVCERKGGFLYSICGCNKTDAVRIAEALNSYAPLLAENSALRDALAAKVADNQRLKSLAIAGADLAIDVASTGIEASKRSDELERRNAELVAQVESISVNRDAFREAVYKAISIIQVNKIRLPQGYGDECLREIKAQSIKEAFDVIFANFDFGQYNARLGLLDDLESLFIEYAAKVRQGEVK